MRGGVEVALVRHGLPSRIEGVERPDPGLTAVGVVQSHALADMLVHLPIRTIASSDMRRALETAQPTADRLGADITVDPDLAELDLGADFYIPFEEMAAENDPRLHRWRDVMASEQGSAALAEFRQRAEGAVHRLSAQGSAEVGGAVAVFCHGGVIGVCVEKALGDARVALTEPEYASVTRIVIEPDGRWKLWTYNEIHHLERAAMQGGSRELSR